MIAKAATPRTAHRIAAPAAPATTPAAQFTAKERDFVYGVAMRYMKDEEDAHDVAQDAMLLAYRHLDSFRGNSRFTTWLYRIAATTALMRLRSDRRARRAFPSHSPDGERPDATAVACRRSSPEQQVAAREAVDVAAGRLARMGDGYAQVFRMRFADGCSGSEIARELGLSVAAVKTRAQRARSSVKDSLASP